MTRRRHRESGVYGETGHAPEPAVRIPESLIQSYDGDVSV